jgi:hypothetical protein
MNINSSHISESKLTLIYQTQQFLHTFAIMFRSLFVLFFFYTSAVLAQQKLEVKADLQSEWLVFKDNQYVKAEQPVPASAKTIYLKIDAGQYRHGYLEISSGGSFHLFINGKLMNVYKGTATIDLDSISSRVNNDLLFAIYGSELTQRSLKTYITVPVSATTSSPDILRPDTAFRDFVILSGLVVIILFVVMIRMHPKLASDYFSVTKIFTLREGDEGLSTARITGSSNILFYIFCSLLIGLYLLMILYHLPDHFTLPLNFKATTFGLMFWYWIKLSSIILALLFTKILLTYSLSNLFGMKGIAGTHFQNWVRLTLLVVSALSLILFVYYISRGQNADVYIGFMTALIIVLIGCIIIAFLKLNSKTEHSMFHLFSYICATEIIPLLITIKVLFQ